MHVSQRRDILRNFAVSPEFCMALYSPTHTRTNSSGVCLSGVGDGSAVGLLAVGDDVATVGVAVGDESPLHDVSTDMSRATDAHPTIRTTRTSRDQPRARTDPRAEPHSRGSAVADL